MTNLILILKITVIALFVIVSIIEGLAGSCFGVDYTDDKKDNHHKHLK